MVNIEKISESAMKVITYSGMAKSCYLEALSLAKQGDFVEAEKKIEEGNKSFVEAHDGHMDVLQEEMASLEPQISLLMTHAEDQLMSAETIKIVIMELIELYKEKKEN
ncbi:MAG: PTS lactose/cellobiose transporter subunit IIA [Eubacteriales bacterium]|nr:PTS lactose/cellobiose transporter subunit IIA [Eubacteriales bacterium]